MFYLRPVQLSDVDQIHALSQLQTFINLPSDLAVLRRKVEASLKTFSSPSKKLEDNYYIFVLIDGTLEKVIGVAMIHGKHGTEREPHFFLSVGIEEKFSKTLNTGFSHGTLKFGLETDGYSEVGGLILDPAYRGHEKKLGKQLSFVRFLYMGCHQEEFTELIHSELMPPFDSHGRSPLWEAIGRRFMNMDYHDADMLSRENREFIMSLYPSATIYGTLLPPEARNAIGKVGRETEPVRSMLESIGFCYTQEVDPFDGGPHYRARLRDITLVRDMISGKIVFSDTEKFDDSEKMLVELPIGTHDFRVVCSPIVHHDGCIIVPAEYKKLVPGPFERLGHAIPF